MTTTTTHAPRVNSVTAKIRTTSRQTTAAVALMMTLRRHPDSRWWRWCLVIPAPAMVKPVRTPMAYIGISDATWARVAASRAIEATASTMMPLENTRRCPRTVRVRGRKESSATKLTRKGNPVKLVLAARIRMTAVDAWSSPYSRDPAAPCPYTSRPISETTVGRPELKGRAWARADRTDTPRNIDPRMVLMTTRVNRALAAWGSRKTLTPFDMASVPVMAEPPLAKARAAM